MTLSSTDSNPARRPSPQLLTGLVAVLTVCVVGSILTVLRSVITPLLLGLLLLLLLNPLVSQLDARRFPRWLTYILLFVGGAVCVLGMEQLIESQGRELKNRLPEYTKRASAAMDKYAQTFGFADSEGRFDRSRFGLLDVLPIKTDDLVAPILGIGLEVLELCTMALFYLLFGLMESQHFTKRIHRSLSNHSADELNAIIESVQNDVGRYLWTKTLISIGLGLTTAALGWLFSLDFWLLWGFLMFLANYVTYIGSIAALGPPILIAFVQFEQIAAAIVLAILLIVVRMVWIDYVEMRYSGKQVNVSPFLVLFAVALMGWMWGPVGMLLSVPLLTVTRVILGRFEQTRYVASLISDLEE